METALDDRRTRPVLAFSLLNLLLGSALLVAVISHVVASRELNSLKGEVKRLRAELGYLDIKDPKKCYVTYVPQLETGYYLFRIYLPSGHRYLRRYSLESHSVNGVSKMGGSGSISESGEMTLRAKFYRDERGDFRISVQGMGTTSGSVFSANSAIASGSSSSTLSSPSSNQTDEIAPGDPIKLLTLDVEKSGDPSTRDVIKIWLEDPSKPLAETAK